LIDNAYGRQDKNLNRKYGLKIINDSFAKYNVGYVVESIRESTGEKRTFWRVKKADEELRIIG
jgi:hypothetical protein